jgi:hypothetical protein
MANMQRLDITARPYKHSSRVEVKASYGGYSRASTFKLGGVFSDPDELAHAAIKENAGAKRLIELAMEEGSEIHTSVGRANIKRSLAGLIDAMSLGEQLAIATPAAKSAFGRKRP